MLSMKIVKAAILKVSFQSNAKSVAKWNTFDKLTHFRTMKKKNILDEKTNILDEKTNILDEEKTQLVVLFLLLRQINGVAGV